jgi:hypothetical protein
MPGKRWEMNTFLRERSRSTLAATMWNDVRRFFENRYPQRSLIGPGLDDSSVGFYQHDSFCPSLVGQTVRNP